MAMTKTIFDEILTCTQCYGTGATGWVSPDEDFDFDYCECNPNGITADEIQEARVFLMMNGWGND